jgi:hypothetical protein
MQWRVILVPHDSMAASVARSPVSGGHPPRPAAPRCAPATNRPSASGLQATRTVYSPVPAHSGQTDGEAAAPRAGSTRQELLELFGGHPVPTDLEPLFGVAFVIDVVRRIGENQIHRLRRHEVFYVGSKSGVSAKHAMITECPHIARKP